MAVSAKNIIMLDLTMTLGYGSIVIAALLNAKSELNFTEEQASWFGNPFSIPGTRLKTHLQEVCRFSYTQLVPSYPAFSSNL